MTTDLGRNPPQQDLTAVTQCVLAERQARDHGWWDQMAASYWPGASIELSWYNGDSEGFVAASRANYERGVRGVHRLFAPIPYVRGDKAHVEIGSRNWSQSEINGKVANLNANMRLNYRLAKRGGEWRIISLVPIYEHSELTANRPGDIIEVPAEELSRYRPSYAALSWALSRKGLTMSQDELGIDRPEEVEKFYKALLDWLEG